MRTLGSGVFLGPSGLGPANAHRGGDCCSASPCVPPTRRTQKYDRWGCRAATRSACRHAQSRRPGIRVERYQFTAAARPVGGAGGVPEELDANAPTLGTA